MKRIIDSGLRYLALIILSPLVLVNYVSMISMNLDQKIYEKTERWLDFLLEKGRVIINKIMRIDN
jgi:hypothetical protein